MACYWERDKAFGKVKLYWSEQQNMKILVTRTNIF